MIFNINQLYDFFSVLDTSNTIRKGGKIYYNLPMAFDIETCSFYEKNNVIYTNEQINDKDKRKANKKAIMYIWQIAIDGNVIYGRTWEEFNYFIHSLYNFLDLGNNKYIIVYVHNLSYEFQFIAKRFEWLEVFADDVRKPLKAETKNHIIFKCSYRLSGYSLETVAKNLKNAKIKKLVGNLDYTLLRNSKTILNDDELNYCVNDVLIVNEYIKEQIEEYGNIINIPLTQTGKVRRYVREECLENEKYRFMIKKLTLEKTEYLMLKNAFMGGFTHCNAMYTNNILHNVTSYDFTSSYPTVLISEKYPMGKGRQYPNISEKDFFNLIKKYCVLVDVEISGLESVFLYDNIISASKCRELKNPLINNGRLVKAEHLKITLTDIDYINVKRFYKWEKIIFGLCFVYEKNYLPKEFIETILRLYSDKTRLKGIAGKENEYLHAKEMLNSLYGMNVTSIVRDVIDFKEEWGKKESNIEKELDIYNKDKTRFLFYPWGVWCTAYARNNLYSGLLECKQDYVYSDTDSIKILNVERHKKYFIKYNEWIIQKLERTLKHYGINEELIRPKTAENVEKPLGIWDFDGFYSTFKTLGAKRYIVLEDEILKVTICGLSKKKGAEYIGNQKNPFCFFSDGMYIDDKHTGKMIHTYIDKEISGELTDYQGNNANYNEKSFIHLENTDYFLSLSDMYIKYFMGVQNLF